jgi:uncharacterized protein
MEASDPSLFPDEIQRPGEYPAAGPAVAKEIEFCKLDPRVVQLWRITRSIGYTVFFGFIVVASTVVLLATRNFGLYVPVVWGVIFLFFAFLVFWYPRRAYEAWGYRVDDKVFEARSGIFFRVIQLLPLSRLQHVDLHRGPLERAHVLASLVLYTAGTHAAILVIPGLDADEAARLRDHLVEIGGDDGV